MNRGNYAVLVNEFLPCPWTHIFNTPQFFEIHRTPNACYLQLVAKASGEVVSTIQFAEESPGVFRSPRLGTFGSFDFKEPPGIELVELFADETERVLRDRGAARITIVSPPFAHGPELSHLVFLALHNRGYHAVPHSLNQSVRLDDRPFSARVDADGRRRLLRARELGLEARQLTSLSELSDAYQLIHGSMCRKGYTLSMSWDRIREMAEIFGDRIHGFGVFRGQEPAAASITIRVSRHAVYVFCWADAAGFSGVSPIVLLAETIYEHARAEGARWMDIGSSTNDGAPNYGLIHFKRNLGCEASLKLAYSKSL
ncbi:MAG TPA: GNAT family N-acetyltransferase [Vicinamibacterales bacterium]|nr:GNAT family N-acetyltransferase [Vicinamibacterales bacterium]